eukprot:NODE_1265_length_928_cov_170.862672_g1219_i0.p1 GENE.NODE_1265_length_928_cov_170.862672_g1219_i0~~NODE_1265_length_928_cov_170.862672_g1219_i0.p1  ORF type:complete len:155 (+),score=21.68 NODE_1265_length_928_cov_170.862672_g1219_i0:422-886(+)
MLRRAVYQTYFGMFDNPECPPGVFVSSSSGVKKIPTDVHKYVGTMFPETNSPVYEDPEKFAFSLVVPLENQQYRTQRGFSSAPKEIKHDSDQADKVDFIPQARTSVVKSTKPVSTLVDHSNKRDDGPTTSSSQDKSVKAVKKVTIKREPRKTSL